MKIQCDVCGSEAAAVFCCADEAALCDRCDRHVHCANKLAGKHHRLSLSSSSAPLCDVCQEKRGFIFCREDRAVLCRGCDEPIHAANEHTMAHTRFLLANVRLSAASAAAADDPRTMTGSSWRSSSSFSDYLMKTLPGWHVEDLLAVDDNQEASPLVETNLVGCGGGEHDAAVWQPIWAAPHVPQMLPSGDLSLSAAYHHHHQLHGLTAAPPKTKGTNPSVSRKAVGSQASFMVPEIRSAPAPANKRTRSSASSYSSYPSTFGFL